MLSRHAELLFWVGRYLERAMQTARLLDVARLSQLGTADSEDRLRELLAVLYQDEVFAVSHPAFTSDAVVSFLVADPANAGSVVSSVAAARESLHNVRELVPIDLLEVVNQLHLRLRSSRTAEQLIDQPAEFFDWIRTQSQRIAGVVHDSMVRSDGFRFLLIGRFLERAEMTLRNVDVHRVVGGEAFEVWTRVLRSVSGLHAFTQLYGASARADDVVRFLLTGTDAPCSVQFCLRRCEADLRLAYGRSQATEAQRVLGRVRSGVEFADVPNVRDPALGDLIRQLEIGIRDVSETLRRDLFRSSTAALHPYEAV